MERGLARGVLTWGGRAVPEIAERSLGGSMGAAPSEHLAGARPATSIPSASGGGRTTTTHSRSGGLPEVAGLAGVGLRDRPRARPPRPAAPASPAGSPRPRPVFAHLAGRRVQVGLPGSGARVCVCRDLHVCALTSVPHAGAPCPHAMELGGGASGVMRWPHDGTSDR